MKRWKTITEYLPRELVLGLRSECGTSWIWSSSATHLTFTFSHNLWAEIWITAGFLWHNNDFVSGCWYHVEMGFVAHVVKKYTAPIFTVWKGWEWHSLLQADDQSYPLETCKNICKHIFCISYSAAVLLVWNTA